MITHTIRRGCPFLLLLFAASGAPAQTLVPEPPLGPVPPSGVSVRLEPFAQLPATSGDGLRARLSMMRTDPADTDTLWINDLRGPLYRLVNAQPVLFIDLRDHLPAFTDSPGLGAGFQSFALHPEFAQNGRFYTVHTEDAGSGTADYTGPEVASEFVQGVVTEWTAENPAATTFTGTRRELLRIGFPHQIHGIQEAAFNPNAVPGHPDYGILYITVGDGGSFNVGQPGNLNRTDSLYGTVLRIDPEGTDGPNGNYGIPADNPFAAMPEARPEVYAYGFRNPHRIVFQPAALAADPEAPYIFVNDIGERNFEEVNLLEAGANYGWPWREGTYLFRGESTQYRDYIYELPENDDDFGYTYPVAQWDRSPENGRAIGSGIFYGGTGIAGLHGHYVMGNIPEGELYHFPVSAVTPGEQTPVYEFFLGAGSRVERMEDRYTGRVDIRLGTGHDGEMYVMVKSDGRVFRMTADPDRWRGYSVRNGWVDSGDWLGALKVDLSPWIFSRELDKWLYWPAPNAPLEDGAWVFVPSD